MAKTDQTILGPGAPDFGKLVDRLMRIKSQAMVEQVTGQLSDELLARADDTPFVLNALCAVKGQPREAATLGQAMMMEAEKIDNMELGTEGQCWILLAALRGHGESRHYLDELTMATVKTPSYSPGTAGPESFRVPRFGRTPRIGADDVHPDVLTDGLPEAEASPAGPGRMVLREIGDPKSKDGLELHKRFKHTVGVQLAYGGAVPAPGQIMACVNARWPWAADVARFLEGRMALMRHSFSDFVRLPPILLVGPTGSGKTTIATEVGDVLGLHVNVVSCGGVADSGGLAATTRGWITTRPSAPFLAMAQSATANPLMVLDELDKGTPARSQNGSVWASALSMLEKSDRYHDSCLQADVDLSAITWIATANDVSVMPIELRDRFMIVNVPRPRPEDFPIVLQGALAEEARAMQTDIDLLPALDRDDRAFLRDMFVQRRNSLRSFRKVIAMMLAEKAVECEQQPRMLN
jgi:hypothetical protein